MLPGMESAHHKMSILFCIKAELFKQDWFMSGTTRLYPAEKPWKSPIFAFNCRS
jgi:hypothetical protein